MYLNGTHYSDSCLAVFMNQAKQQPWYKNTVFIFCSDHSHGTPRQNDYYSPRYRQIVCFLYGDAIKPAFRGLKINKVGNHHDLAVTLLKQLNGDAKPFVWSKNLLNPYTKNFASCEFDYGMLFMDDSSHYAYRYTDDYFLNKFFQSPQDSVRLMHYGRAYLQELYRQYLAY